MIVRVLFLLFISTVVNAQTGPCGVQTGPLKADLSIRLSEVKFIQRTFTAGNSADDCNVEEGNISRYGLLDLVIFTTTTPNIGDADLVFGDPRNCGEMYELETCHGHAHLRNYATYRIWKEAAYALWVKARNLDLVVTGTPNEAFLIRAVADGNVVEGRKEAFCIIDFFCTKGNCLFHPPDTPGWFRATTQQFGQCINQGLTVGWSDSYGNFLDGQWVETGSLVKGQKYVLEVQLNPDHVFQEKSYLNNVDAVKFVY